MHSNFAGAEPRRIRSVHFRAPDGAAVLAAAHGEHKVAAITTAGKPVGTHHTGGNVMYVRAIWRGGEKEAELPKLATHKLPVRVTWAVARAEPSEVMLVPL